MTIKDLKEKLSGLLVFHILAGGDENYLED